MSTMKLALLTCALWLTLAGSGWAGTQSVQIEFEYPDKCRVVSDPRLICVYDSRIGTATISFNIGAKTIPENPCLATLEAAMRKMEPLIFKTIVPKAMWYNSPAYTEAWEQWDAAKRACWREKP